MYLLFHYLKSLHNYLLKQYNYSHHHYKAFLIIDNNAHYQNQNTYFFDMHKTNHF